MKAEILGGFLQIYPENTKEELELTEYFSDGINEKIGAVHKTVENGVPLKEKKLAFIQIAKKGTPLSDGKAKVGGNG